MIGNNFQVFDPVHAIYGQEIGCRRCPGVLCSPILRFAPLSARTVVVARRHSSNSNNPWRLVAASVGKNTTKGMRKTISARRAGYAELNVQVATKS
jgi:hypothetical protein